MAKEVNIVLEAVVMGKMFRRPGETIAQGLLRAAQIQGASANEMRKMERWMAEETAKGNPYFTEKT